MTNSTTTSSEPVTKQWFKSRTVWANAIMAAVSSLALAAGVSPETIALIAPAVSAVVNVILRAKATPSKLTLRKQD